MYVVPTSHLASYCCCCCSCRSFFSFSMLRSTLYLPSFLLYKVFSVSFWCISAAFYSAADGTRSFYFLLQLQHYRDGPYYLIHSANILICSSITCSKVFWNKLRLTQGKIIFPSAINDNMHIFYKNSHIGCMK